MGIDPAKAFLKSKSVQDKAATAWVKLMWHSIEAENLHRHAWTEVGGVEPTPSGMPAATHLPGTNALEEFIQSGGKADLRDPYGMPITSHMIRMADDEVPFGPRQGRSAAAWREARTGKSPGSALLTRYSLCSPWKIRFTTVTATVPWLAESG